MPRSAITLAVLAGLLAGCAVRVPAAHDRFALIDIGTRSIEDIEWPRRVAYDPDGTNAAHGLAPLFSALGPHARGYLYAFDGIPLSDSDVTGLLFVSERPSEDRSHRSGPLTLTITPQGGRPQAVTFPPGVTGTFLAVWTPAPDSGSAEAVARGLVVYLGSLGGVSRPERALIDRLVNQGWAVLGVTPSSELLSRHARVYSGHRGSIDGLAGAIAQTIDDSFAERAYAVQAGLAYVRANVPGVPLRPLVLVGTSLGAVHLPAVAASLERPPDAAVLIGGGADFLRLMSSSPLGRDLVKVTWIHAEPAPDDELVYLASPRGVADLAFLFDPVRERSRLDPYHTAVALARVPVLQLHARFDAIVPAFLGDLLHERLGRPERWIYATGHVGLFVMMHLESRRIAEWIDAATR